MKILVVGDSGRRHSREQHIFLMLNLAGGNCCAEGGRSIVDSLIAVKSAYTLIFPWCFVGAHMLFLDIATTIS
ncbi:hypothetical protein Avbf_12101 [Armadillidium vulgare]|nr:hypothetical protein Avbf_12101 [Armadillidium vulgare]